MRRSAGAGRPDSRTAEGWGLLPRAQWLTQVLLNDHRALRITSGRRTRWQNLRIPGATLNGHTSGREVDVVGPEEVMRAAAAQARRSPGTWTLIHDAGTGRHLHIRWPA